MIEVFQTKNKILPQGCKTMHAWSFLHKTLNLFIGVQFPSFEDLFPQSSPNPPWKRRRQKSLLTIE